ncbi:beta-class carbonic anhydrase [Actinomycetospora chibensis]|jgi:carbonic anhydrase|uniref:carbonic anhydrase n=1 Tax=Actinomycetospora chibensis TaxID=663606 RepID=A0ABV9RTE6_9PSEU|nr:carbonic anhydrase [Actinomycetospora chibensis]MDD7924416.1 carbonic anhydrase [Actinomycetospora chibensis]
MSTTDELLTANESFAEGFSTPGLPGPPSRGVAVVACMDARLDVYRVLGLGNGEAHVIRNAGGVVTDDVLRSLAVSQRKLATREVVLIHHTKCGMATFTDDDFVAELEADTGQRPTWVPGTFPDTEQDVRDSLAAVRDCPFLVHTDAVRGFVYDVDTGSLTEVS